MSFRRATRLRYDYRALFGGVYVTHVDESGVGVVSRLEMVSSPLGQLLTQQNSGGFILPPTFRQKTWGVTQKFGGSDPTVPGNQRLSGNSPIDVCTDEMMNTGFAPNQVTPHNNGVGASIIQHSSKGAVVLVGGAGAPPFTPKYLFIALSDVGAVDVFDLDTRTKVTTISIPGVTALSNYWKQ